MTENLIAIEKYRARYDAVNFAMGMRSICDRVAQDVISDAEKFHAFLTADGEDE